jgi:putative tryptophan/tyrosine transport system substrate-binding protein
MGGVGRRQFLIATGAILATPLIAEAQSPGKVRRIGILTLGTAPATSHIEAFRQGLREHGYVEGQGIALEYRFAQGTIEKLPALAAELVRLNVDIIVTESTPAALAAKQASARIPIVMAIGGGDPVLHGLVASLRRPGGNVTGLTLEGAARTGKQLQLLKEALPKTTLVAVIYNAAHPNAAAYLQEAKDAGQSLGLQLKLVAVRGPADLDEAFRTVTEARPSAFITLGDGMLLGNRERICEFAAKSRLPGAFPTAEFAEAGGLMAYGPNLAANYHRAAAFVDKILKGAKPGDLPVEQPTKFELVINLKTAKALGMSISQSMLVRADRAIE